jgi:DNA-3-methyladenine glycosylase
VSKILKRSFFDQDAIKLAKALLGKVLCARYQGLWLCAQVIETEAYYIHEKASHASLGFTEKRRALFMAPGTIYMYYSRGGDSLNVSAKGEGNAVLIKSAIPYVKAKDYSKMIQTMQELNPLPNNRIRDPVKLCSGQVLMCRALNLKVKKWDQQQFDHEHFFIKDMGYHPAHIIETIRLGIRKDRDAHLPFRFIDKKYLKFCTKSALK